MTAKKRITEKGVLESSIRKFMTPQAMEDLKILMENPTLQQFLLRWQEADHEVLSEQLREELQEFLKDIYLKDNEALCKNVADIVRVELAETLLPFARTLERVEKNISTISKDVGEIKLDIIDIKKRLKTDEEILVELEKRIYRLEKYASIGWTVVRNLITAAISIGVGIITFLEIHEKLPK